MKAILIFATLNLALFGLANNGENENSSSEINKTDEQGLKQGKWIFLGKDQPEKGYPLEGKISEGIYEDDRKNGKWTTFYKDGETPKLIGEFVNNRPNGMFQKFYPNGNLKEVGTFRGQKYIDSLKRFNVDGTLIYEANYNTAGQESGEVKYFYDNGKPEFIYNAVNGIPSGKATRYWNNGEIKEEVEYSKEGEKIYSTGILEPMEELSEEVKKGAKKSPEIKKVTANFKPEDYNIVYNKNNEVWMEGEFKNQRLWDGRLYIYDTDGLLLRVEVYKEGIYHSNGQL